MSLRRVLTKAAFYGAALLLARNLDANAAGLTPTEQVQQTKQRMIDGRVGTLMRGMHEDQDKLNHPAFKNNASEVVAISEALAARASTLMEMSRQLPKEEVMASLLRMRVSGFEAMDMTDTVEGAIKANMKSLKGTKHMESVRDIQKTMKRFNAWAKQYGIKLEMTNKPIKYEGPKPKQG